MKRKDLTVIIVAAVIAAIFSIILSGTIIGSPTSKKNVIKVPVVNTINPVFPSPKTDDSYKLIFNQNALNPTQLIRIGDNSNTNPFQGTGQ